MKARHNLTLISALVSSSLVTAQIMPDVSDVTDRITERQVEAAAEKVVERTVKQAEEAQSRAADKVAAQQAEIVENQVAEQVASQVERVQDGVADKVQNQVEQVQSQVADKAQAQVEQVQSKAVDMARTATEQVVDRVPEAALQATEALSQAGSEVAQDAAQNPLSGGGDADPGTDSDETGDSDAALDGEERLQVTDDDGNAVFTEVVVEPGIRAVEFEWIMAASSDEVRQLNDEAPELMRFLSDRQDYSLVDGELLVFSVPPDLDTDEAILDLVPPELRDRIDRNHIYASQDARGAGGAGLTLPMSAVCRDELDIGIIDTAVHWQHPAFSALEEGRVISRSFVDGGLKQFSHHGTAVTAVLVGRDPAGKPGLRPLLPNARVRSAAVFHTNENLQIGATAMRILQALDWFREEGVLTVNMSLAGPPNRLLEQAVGAMTARGFAIVAAVGNDGPYAPARYPAAYDGVIGVTAVDAQSRIFPLANQGPHVDFAALGVGVQTAGKDNGFGSEAGTSLAVPVVTAFMACTRQGAEHFDTALQQLISQVRDLGAAGRDDVFGHGLLHPAVDMAVRKTHVN